MSPLSYLAAIMRTMSAVSPITAVRVIRRKG